MSALLSDMVRRIAHPAPGLVISLLAGLVGVAWAQVGEPASPRMPLNTPIGDFPVALGDITLPVALVLVASHLKTAIAAVVAWRPRLDLRVELHQPPTAPTDRP